MIDLHCHLLPGVDDGATDLDDALALARVAWEDGITTLACTPHIYPGLYDNTAEIIHDGVASLQDELAKADIPLTLVAGADAQLTPNMLEQLKTGRIPTLAGSRYFLFEPPHHVAPPRMADVIFELLAAGYVPIITHPERLTWIEDRYATICEVFEAGAWIQLTAGSITGLFGKRAQYWSERMLDEGRVHIVASDGHNLRRRRPVLSEARERVADRLGQQAALDMVSVRAQGVILDHSPTDMPALTKARRPVEQPARRRWFGGFR
ncbi:tyrosine-protein phosphatase [Brevundimonas sp. KM4]|uniref:tyrosine-protein phosphatase n=1 Tax=Brevundimonas sp. KM4 TaxID=1628191 RepID=UPI0005F7A7E9|nr:CpsB/CapC family capsule biosynthesis tyrosine phosphatase [Brevundimonas sp. KM4]KJV43333.1 capsular biosynthesis protein [Brevundimonas sp. KM4]